jgi:hypothetical protein
MRFLPCFWRVASSLLLLAVVNCWAPSLGSDAVLRSASSEEEPVLSPEARKARIEEARRVLAEQDEAFKEQVNAAIDRGVAWLRTQQKKQGGFPGFSENLPPNTYDTMEVGVNALVILTLAHCGVGPDEKVIKNCLNFCRGHYSGKTGLNLKNTGKLTIYTAATLILALDALYVPPEEKVQAPKNDRYGNPVPPKPLKCKYPKAIRKWIEELVDFIVKNQVKPAGGWRYPENIMGGPDGATDLSNTQYALLALDAASRCGILAPVETWTRAAGYVLKEQDADGLDAPIWMENEAWEPGFEKPARFLEAAKTLARGWTYLPGDTELPTGSMTTAGVTCLAMCKEHLWARKKLEADMRARLDKGMLAGIAWLSENWSVEENPTPGGASQWHYYYLYGLERTGSKLGSRWIGKQDWYRAGAAHLLAAQEKNGQWKEPDGTVRPADATESATTQTCFALLFLRRSTRKPFLPMMPAVTGGGAEPADGR